MGRQTELYKYSPLLEPELRPIKDPPLALIYSTPKKKKKKDEKIYIFHPYFSTVLARTETPTLPHLEIQGEGKKKTLLN